MELNLKSDVQSKQEGQDVQNKQEKKNYSLDAIKTARDSYKTRPKLDIKPDDPNNPWMSRGESIIKSAGNITTNSSSSGKKTKKSIGIDCTKNNPCEVKFSKKTCVESIPIKKVCKITPKVTVVTKEYPDCKIMDVRQGHRNYCQSGYKELLHTDMIDGPTWDDIFMCSKPTILGESSECYAGYLVKGRPHSVNRNGNPGYTMGRAMIPKGMKGYVRFMHTYHGPMVGTIYNETKDEVYRSGEFSGGQTVELPVLEGNDQVFRFDLNNGRIGVVVFYVQNHLKKVQIEMKESCHAM